MGTGITAEALRARLAQTLQPMHLEVLDESAAHLGHAGQDGVLEAMTRAEVAPSK